MELMASGGPCICYYNIRNSKTDAPYYTVDWLFWSGIITPRHVYLVSKCQDSLTRRRDRKPWHGAECGQ